MVFNKLQQALDGDVRNDLMTKQIYSVDASILEIPPDLVVLPKHEQDLIKTVEIACDHSVPLIPRGGGTGIAGGCLGEGIVIDTSKYLNKILELNLEEGWVRCEPGVILDPLNAFLAPHGYRIGPETSTANRATIGGMTATNAAGARYLKYGNMQNHVLEVEVVLSSGEKKAIKQEPSQTFERRSSGYLPASVMVGSEGTLGLFSSITLRLSPLLKNPILIVLFFPTLEESLKAVPEILKTKPISVELLDQHVLEMGRLTPTLAGKLDKIINHTGSLLLVEYEEAAPCLSSSQMTLHDSTSQAQVWALRKAGLGLLLSRRSYSRAVAFIEDLVVPADSLSLFVRDLQNEVKREMGIYGHAGDGCLHIRPYVDLRSEKEIDWMFDVMEPIATLVKHYGGFMSGEHGDGLIRSWLNPQFFTEEEYSHFLKIKKSFDPLNLMNPGKIVEAQKPRQYVRKVRPQTISTFLNFEKEGGLHLAADLCNGNGACRKKTTLMCPSFHAFGDERHTTRARAQSLRSILNGNLPIEELTGKGLLDVLDYCLECKGCKTECPSHIDMAKMKMEILYQYQEKHGYSLLNRLFGHLPKLAKVASKTPTLSNRLGALFGPRPLPQLAPERFSKWWNKQKKKNKEIDIYLFNDTFTEFFSPEVGKATVEVLMLLGYTVEVLPHICCGRTYLSKGMLKQAKKQALAVVEMLREKKAIVLEPSCLSAIQDDYPSLISQSPTVYTLEGFLPPLSNENPLLFHPHCHEQALLEEFPLFKHFPHLHLSDAGCCGLAGSFGYEKRHYEMSMAIGESRLFPLARKSEIPIVAPGFSCRHQILHGTGKKALHPSEFIQSIIKN